MTKSAVPPTSAQTLLPCYLPPLQLVPWEQLVPWQALHQSLQQLLMQQAVAAVAG
jgi:hypothetical protein